MSSSICRFMPMKNSTSGIRAVNFVLETELKKLKQPFFRVIHSLHLVTRGTGFFKYDSVSSEIKRGSLFAVPAGGFFELCDCSEDFEYAYISFMGDGAETFLTNAGISGFNNVFHGFDGLIPMWLESLRRINENNSDILPVSVLLYTLSYIDGTDDGIRNESADSIAESIVRYVKQHYDNPEISLRYVAGIFNYTQKYLSALFKKKNGVGFCEFVNSLRVQKAVSMIENGAREIIVVSKECGFTDPLYFSKVFKNKTGRTPTEYMKNRAP